MRVLCVRFSAIGDVAMIAPVLKGFAEANPEVEFIVVSRAFAKSFYEGLAPNVSFHAIDLKSERYKGLLGLEHLYRDLKPLHPDIVCDLHDVLRTKYVRMRFALAGLPVFHIDKHREGKRALAREKNKQLCQQPTAFENYAEVLRKAGLRAGAPSEPVLNLASGDKLHAVGIAPFAAHKGKIYPIEKMQEVIDILMQRHPDLKIMLFGGGKKEEEVFTQWEQRHPCVTFISKKCTSMREEMGVMQQMKCMVTMDSGNMHMASLVGVPVVSIWGATHPLAGFMGWKQKSKDALQLDMPCRPCSVYGNKPCLRSDYACMNGISPENVVDAIEKYLIIKKS